MNQKSVNFLRVLVALFCIFFGADKFLELIPTCSLINHITPEGMFVLGVLEIIIGVALLGKWNILLMARLATAMMIGGLLMHLIKGTNDFGGATVGALLGLSLIFTYKKFNK